MNQKKKTALIIGIIILVFVVIGILTVLQDRIAKNPAGTIGNTAGNLNNKGLFCEADGKVYFSNAYDNNALYSMNSDETEMKKISNAQAQYINAGGKYLYYYQETSNASQGLGFIRPATGVYRSKTNGKDVTCLKRDPSGILTLVDNTLYYQHYDNRNGMSLYRMNTDKTDDKEIQAAIINPASVQNNQIYFNGIEGNHYLYALNTLNNSITTIWEGNVWNPVADGDYVYYMDVANDYRLCRYSLSAQSVEILTSDRIDTFNVYGNIIYYQKNSQTEPALKRMNIDGSNPEIVAEGNFMNINITSNNVYFQGFDSPVPIYKTSTFGPVSVTTFDAALHATLTE